MKVTETDLRKCLNKARREYRAGIRYYDEKHKTHNPATMSENILERVSDLLGLFGVEAYDAESNNPSRPAYSYINAGDCYRLTLIYSRKSGRFYLGCIGDIVERESNMK